MATEKKEILMFCANEQKEVAHVLDIDGNGEIVLTCKCGRFVKLPRGTDAKGLKNYIATHKKANIGQVSKEAMEANKAKLLKDLGI